MEEQNISAEKPNKKYWKFVLGFFVVIVGVFVLYGASILVWQKYKQWQGEKAVEKLAEELKRLEEENYQMAMADTYGGKTPEETLQMYIETVEKGDYELASKYFIEENRGEKLRGLQQLNNNRLKYIVLLKELLNNAKSSPEKYYSSENIPGGREFIIDKPIYLRLILYPNGIWKIIEI